MAGQQWIWVALGISGVAFCACMWQLANMRGYKSRGRRRVPQAQADKRKSDSRALSPHEKRLYSEAQKLLASGNVLPAARILEQLQMPREAIQALEDHGQIHEAAKILMRLQRANRAGVVYARHGMWENAAQCFKMANMPLEVAKCSREAGNFAVAAEYFHKAQRYEEAAECLEQLGELQKAARMFSSAGQKDRAMQLYNKLARTTDNLAGMEFLEEELKQIVDYLGDGNTDAGLAAVVVSRNRLTDVVLNLVGKGLVKQASELFLRATSDIGPMLMADVNYQDHSARTLAEVFLAVSNYNYAGMIFERMSSFDDAGWAFEQAEDFERASYCFERAGQEQKARTLKEKAKTTPYRGRVGSSNFALASVAGSESVLAPARVDEESTAVVDMSAKNLVSLEPAYPSVPPPPVPAQLRFSMNGENSEPEATDYTSDAHASDLPPPPAPPSIDDASEPLDEPETEAPRYASSTQAVPPPPFALHSAPMVDDDDEDAFPDASPVMPPSQVTLDEGRAAFHHAKFFADLDFEQKNKLWNVGTTQSYAEGANVLTYNDEPRGIYVIVQGSVSCYRQVGGKESYVDQMSESESFGELWLLADQPTAVRFVASKDTKIRIISRDAFNDLLDKDGTIARKVYKRFTMRLLKRLLRPQNNSKAQAAS